MKYTLSLNGEEVAGTRGSLSDVVDDACRVLYERNQEIGCYRDCDLIAISAQHDDGPQIVTILLFESMDSYDMLIVKRWDVRTGVTARCEWHPNCKIRLARVPMNDRLQFAGYVQPVVN